MLPLLERSLASLQHAPTPEPLPRGTSVALAQELAAAVHALGKPRDFARMSRQHLQWLTCAVRALTNLYALLTAAGSALEETVLEHVDAAVDDILEPMLANVSALGRKTAAAQVHTLVCECGVLGASRDLLVRRSHLQGANVRARLRSLLAATARCAAREANEHAQGDALWGWDLRQEPRRGTPSDGEAVASAAKGACELVADILAGCAVASRCGDVMQPASPSCACAAPTSKCSAVIVASLQSLLSC